MDGQKQVEELAKLEAEKAAPAKEPRHSFMDIRRPKPTAETLVTDEVKTEQNVDESKAPAPADVTPAPSSDTAELADDPAQKLEEPKKEKKEKEEYKKKKERKNQKEKEH